jgi:hypothetical protein
MEEFFGVVTPALLVALVSFITEWIKDVMKWDNWKADVTCYALSNLFLVPFFIISTFRITPPETSWDLAWLVFTALVYPFLGWIFAGGYYAKFIAKRNKA